MSGVRAIADSDRLKTFHDSVYTLDAESRVHLEKNGLRITAVDPANVGMVRAMLGPGAFESYELDERALFGVSLQRFDEALSFADSSEPVRVETVDADVFQNESGDRELGGFLELETDGISHDIATIDADSIRQEPDLPDLNLPASVTIEGRQLSRAIRASDTVSDHVILSVDADEEVFRAEAEGDTDSVDVEYDADELVDGTFADARSIYSLDYLQDMTGAIPADAEVKLELGFEFPAIMTWSYAEGDGTVKYVLAPRIESDD